MTGCVGAASLERRTNLQIIFSAFFDAFLLPTSDKVVDALFLEIVANVATDIQEQLEDVLDGPFGVAMVNEVVDGADAADDLLRGREGELEGLPGNRFEDLDQIVDATDFQNLLQ